MKQFFTEQEGVVKPPPEKQTEPLPATDVSPVEAPSVLEPPIGTQADEVGDPKIVKEQKEFFSKEDGKVEPVKEQEPDEKKKEHPEAK